MKAPALAILCALGACAHDAPPPRAAPGPYHDPDLRRGALPGERARRAELAFVRDHVDRMYAHRQDKLARYHLDEDAVFAAAEQRLLAARTWAAYDAAIYDALAAFHDGHLTYHPPQTAAPARGYTPFVLGLDTVIAGEHLLVARVDPGSDVARAGVAPGDEVTAIDGRPVADVLARELRVRAWSRPEAARAGWARTWTHVLVPKGEAPRGYTIDVATRAGAAVHVAVAPREAPRGPHEAVTSARQGEVAVVTIRSLQGRARSTQIDAALAGARGARALVIDLRGDRGGVDTVGARVVAGLAEGKALLATYRVRVAPETLARRPIWRGLTAGPDGFSAPQRLEVAAQPAGRGFHGALAVVVDAGCLSTCEIVAAALRADLHATLVGETTGGSSGAPIEVTLPATGGNLAIPTWDLVAADGKPIEGDGVVPDVAAVATPAALAAGLDLPLQTAIDDVRRRAAAP